MQGELTLRSKAITHAEVALVTQERLAARLERVDADGDVRSTEARDVGHANQAEERRPIGGEPHLGEVVVVGHSWIGSTVCDDLVENPLVAR